MIKKIVVIIIAGILCIYLPGITIEYEAQPNPRENLWPYSRFSFVRAFLYNLDNKLFGQHAIIKHGKLDKTVVGTGVLLSHEQVRILVKLINGDINGLIQGLSKSFIPHHGFVFFDKLNKPVASITLCFDCEAIRLYPEKTHQKTKIQLSNIEIKRLFKVLEQIKQIVRELKLPIFATPFEYSEYGKATQ